MANHIEEYKRQQEILMKNKTRLEEKLQKAIEKYKEIEESNVDKKEARLEVAKKTIVRREYALSQIEDQIDFLRPANDEDMRYRLRQYDEFAKKMKDLVPDDLPLRFHGCAIYTAKHIIESNELSSSADRIGVETSYDTEGQVSVTTKKTLDTTVQSYTHLSNSPCLPAGCVFVLLPKDEIDAKAGDSMLMGNVNFKEEPDRLYGIITTPENIERVSQWAKNSKIDLSKIHDFDEFTMLLEKGRDNMENKTNQPLRNYVVQDDPEIKVSSDYINYTEFLRTDDGKKQIETRKGPLINDRKEVIGESEEIEEYDYATGTTTRNRYETIEGENGIFSVDTQILSRGENLSVHSTMTTFNEISKSKEKAEYIQDEDGNETYTYMENGQVGQKITKTARGTTIDIFKDGQPYATYEYDENGKAIIPMGKMEQLPENYVEYSFKVAIPDYTEISYQEPAQVTVDSQKLGKQTLDEQSDTSAKDEVEQQMREHIKERENPTQAREETDETNKKEFKERMKADPEVQKLIDEIDKELEKGTWGSQEKRKEDSDRPEKSDDDYVM